MRLWHGGVNQGCLYGRRKNGGSWLQLSSFMVRMYCISSAAVSPELTIRSAFSCRPFTLRRIVSKILGEAPMLQDVNYTARPPAEVDDCAFSPDTANVQKVPPIGENAGFCSTVFAMQTRLMWLIKCGDQVVLYAWRKDESDWITPIRAAHRSLLIQELST